MNKAIFLDRDGVINDPKDYYYVKNIDEFHLNKHIINSLKEYLSAGYILIIITNQGGIAKGLYSESQLNEIHKYLNNILLENEIKITEIYYCPHHETKSKCLCRKPNSLLLEKAMARFNINKSKSVFIGDSERDILAGEKINLKSILIKKNSMLPTVNEIFTEI